MWKYYLVGVLVSFPVGLGVMVISFLSYTYAPWEHIPLAIPGGILAGFIGNWLERHLGKWSILATPVLSFFLSGYSSIFLIVTEV